MKGYYSILGVHAGATLDEIATAYKKRLKVLHPDRFDQKRQPDEWQQANKMLQELNEAYSYLKKKHSTGQENSSSYNEGNSRSYQAHNGREEASTQNSEKTEEQRSKRTTSQYNPRGLVIAPVAQLSLNHIHYINHLMRNKEEALTLKNRIVVFDYLVFTTAALIYISNVMAWTRLNEVVSDNYLLGCIWLFVLGALMSICGIRILKYHKAKVKPCVVFTPMYYIKVMLDSVSVAYPWEIRAYNYYKEKYLSYVNIAVGDSNDKFYTPFFFDYEKFKTSINNFNNKRRAVEDPIAWITTNDILRDLKSDKITKLTKLNLASWFVSFLTTILICYYIANAVTIIDKATYDAKKIENYATREANQVASPAGTSGSQPDTSPQPNPSPSFDKPALPLPDTGTQIYYSKDKGVAPLQIVVPDSGEHYFLKIVEISSNLPVRGIFIQSGGKVKMKIPLGVYKIKYATGTTWYGRKYLFGPQTQVTIADSDLRFEQEGNRVSGHSVELIKQVNGNLPSHAISVDEF